MKITRKPNPQLRKIVLEETDDGRDVIRYLKSVLMTIEDGVSLFGLRHKDYARTHKIAAARILARLGLEEGKRYLDRNYVQTPFRRVHPEEEDGPKRDMAASTAQLYRMARQKTRDGADIIIHFVEVMKGCHPEYKPHLRMAAAKELIRQIEFDYDYEDEPTSPAPTHTESESAPASEPVGASLVGAHADTEITAHHQNQTNHSSDPYRQYADQHCAREEESIYQSIVRRASNQPGLESATQDARDLISEFNCFAAERDPDFQPVTVPDDILARSLTQQMNDPESWVFDPAEYYDLDRDDFYFCLCQDCDDCDELDSFIEFMIELEEDVNLIYEDP